MYHWITAACPECSSSTRSQPTPAWPRNSRTPALQQLHWLPIEYRITYKLCLIMHLMHTNRAPQYISDSVQTASRSSSWPGLRSSDTAVYTPSRGAEPSSESAASLMQDLLHGTVFHAISIKSVTLVFSSAASKLNYFVEHTSLVLVSAPGRSVHSVIQMTILLLLYITLFRLTGQHSHNTQYNHTLKKRRAASKIVWHHTSVTPVALRRLSHEELIRLFGKGTAVYRIRW